MATQQLGPATFQEATSRLPIATGILSVVDGKTIFETADAGLSNHVGRMTARSSSQRFEPVVTQLTLWPTTGPTIGPNGGNHNYLVTPAAGV